MFNAVGGNVYIKSGYERITGWEETKIASAVRSKQRWNRCVDDRREGNAAAAGLLGVSSSARGALMVLER